MYPDREIKGYLQSYKRNGHAPVDSTLRVLDKINQIHWNAADLSHGQQRFFRDLYTDIQKELKDVSRKMPSRVTKPSLTLDEIKKRQNSRRNASMDLKRQLIKLGSTNPALRPSIRPVLNVLQEKHVKAGVSETLFNADNVLKKLDKDQKDMEASYKKYLSTLLNAHKKENLSTRVLESLFPMALPVTNRDAIRLMASLAEVKGKAQAMLKRDIAEDLAKANHARVEFTDTVLSLKLPLKYIEVLLRINERKQTLLTGEIDALSEDLAFVSNAMKVIQR